MATTQIINGYPVTVQSNTEASAYIESSNTVPIGDTYLLLNTLRSQLNSLKSSPLVSDTEIAGIKSEFQPYFANIGDGSTEIVKTGYDYLHSRIPIAQATITNYSNAVASANQNMYFGGALFIVFAVVISIIIFKK